LARLATCHLGEVNGTSKRWVGTGNSAIRIAVLIKRAANAYDSVAAIG
jgi:hypothetical protein